MSRYKLPEPAVIVGGRYKGWTQEQIDEWIESRPGQGTRIDLIKKKD